MSSTETRRDTPTLSTGPGAIDMKLEVVVLPVADVDRAAQFYGRPGLAARRRLLAARASGCCSSRRRAPRAPSSFGTGLTSAAPGSAQWLHLIVSDIEAARAELVANGVDVERDLPRRRRGAPTAGTGGPGEWPRPGPA